MNKFGPESCYGIIMRVIYVKESFFAGQQFSPADHYAGWSVKRRKTQSPWKRGAVANDVGIFYFLCKQCGEGRRALRQTGEFAPGLFECTTSLFDFTRQKTQTVPCTLHSNNFQQVVINVCDLQSAAERAVLQFQSKGNPIKLGESREEALKKLSNFQSSADQLQLLKSGEFGKISIFSAV